MKIGAEPISSQTKRILRGAPLSQSGIRRRRHSPFQTLGSFQQLPQLRNKPPCYECAKPAEFGPATERWSSRARRRKGRPRLHLVRGGREAFGLAGRAWALARAHGRGGGGADERRRVLGGAEEVSRVSSGAGVFGGARAAIIGRSAFESTRIVSNWPLPVQARDAHNRNMATVTPSVKQQARTLLDELPDDVTWDQIVYELAVRRSIELGLADADASRVSEINEVRRQFPLSE